ncbi:MAG: hypothetical protein K0Q49_1819 [Haloplasmataceae bacterium]|jgi:hypothetical protein|nr:hypothetical protein [Haloplasmataceae bacterium]
MKEFLRKFFGYYQYEVDGILGVAEPYKDELGMGAFSDITIFCMDNFSNCFKCFINKIFKRFSKMGRTTVVNIFRNNSRF